MREIGIDNYSEMVLEGKGMTSECGSLAAMGVYLMHGGKSEDYKDLTQDESQLILSTYSAFTRKIANDVLYGIIDILNEIGKRK